MYLAVFFQGRRDFSKHTGIIQQTDSGLVGARLMCLGVTVLLRHQSAHYCPDNVECLTQHVTWMMRAEGEKKHQHISEATCSNTDG